MDWTNDFTETDNFETLIESLFKERMKKSDEFCTEVWSSLANVIWVNAQEEDKYSASFRYAGGLISEIIGRGDYMDWYCSGPYQSVSDEISDAMRGFGWVPYSYEGDRL